MNMIHNWKDGEIQRRDVTCITTELRLNGNGMEIETLVPHHLSKPIETNYTTIPVSNDYFTVSWHATMEEWLFISTTISPMKLTQFLQ